MNMKKEMRLKIVISAFVVVFTASCFPAFIDDATSSSEKEGDYIHTSLPEGAYFGMYDFHNPRIDLKSKDDHLLTPLFRVDDSMIKSLTGSDLNKNDLRKEYSVILNERKVAHIENLELQDTDIRINHPPLVKGKYLESSMGKSFLKPIVTPKGIKQVNYFGSEISEDDRANILNDVKKALVPDPFKSLNNYLGSGKIKTTHYQAIRALELSNINNNDIKDYIGSYLVTLSFDGNASIKRNYIFSVIDEKVIPVTHSIHGEASLIGLLDIDGDKIPEIIIDRAHGGHGDDIELIESGVYVDQNSIEIWRMERNSWIRIYKD
ncbi:MAG: hypothetical protein O3B09_01270 [Proteobacteria bacterium]|nr:hypothetical protein [Pseudomonadota bacterium]